MARFAVETNAGVVEVDVNALRAWKERFARERRYEAELMQRLSLPLPLPPSLSPSFPLTLSLSLPSPPPPSPPRSRSHRKFILGGRAKGINKRHKKKPARKRVFQRSQFVDPDTNEWKLEPLHTYTWTLSDNSSIEVNTNENGRPLNVFPCSARRCDRKTVDGSACEPCLVVRAIVQHYKRWSAKKQNTPR